MKSIVASFKGLRHPVALIALAALVLLPVQAEPQQHRTLIGRVDGQKFGTNIVAGDVSVNFEADSEAEERLLAVCGVGDQCKVVVATRLGDVVTRLVSAERLAGNISPAGSVSDQSKPSTPKPSFACAGALAPVERTICRSTELSTLDSRLAQAYQRRLDNAQDGADRRTVQQMQRDWVGKARASCGTDEACLQAVYLARIDALAGTGATRARH